MVHEGNIVFDLNSVYYQEMRENSGLELSKQARLKKWLVRRFSLRGHMSCILVCTAFSGVFFSEMLQEFGLNAMVIRFPLAILLSYGVFFLLVKIWLRIIFPAHDQSAGTNFGRSYGYSYWPTGSLGGASSSSGPAIPQFHGEGGRSGGAGASASWAVAMAPNPAQASPSDSSIFSGLGDVKLPSSGKDNGGLVILILGGVVIAAIFGSAVYLIATSSQILAETAFQFAMSAGLIRSAKRAVEGSWEKTVFRETCLPFLVVLILSLLFGAIAQSNYPEAKTLKDVLQAASVHSSLQR